MQRAHANAEADDAALVAAARADPQAFAALYERYLGPVYRYCHVRLGSREATQDATSDVFLKALAGLSGYRGGVFAAWVFRIAHNVVTDRHRRRRPTGPMEAAGDTEDAGSTPEEVAVAHAEREALRRALTTLPDHQRAAIELRLADWPDERTAVALGKTVAAVKKLRFRAVRRLRKILAPTIEHPKEGHDEEA